MIVFEIIYTVAIIFAVPTPSVEVSIQQMEPYLAGMLAVLQCSITIDSAMDTPIDVAVMWQRNGEEVAETQRVQTFPPHLVAGSQFDALLQFNTLSSSSDSGNYLCITSVSPGDTAPFILNSTQTATYLLTVTGMLLFFRRRK